MPSLTLLRALFLLLRAFQSSAEAHNGGALREPSVGERLFIAPTYKGINSQLSCGPLGDPTKASVTTFAGAGIAVGFGVAAAVATGTNDVYGPF